ncbi:MAG: FHA domain-containing protein [Planctomycetes bacterium]|nr:FHA domain-containing protein [Planctomycetota bacterium]
MIRLVVTAGNQRGKVFDLIDGKTYVLGRGHGVDIEILDIMVSRKHAEVYVRGEEAATLVSLRNTNGTLLNGNETGRHELADGDHIIIGETEIRVSFAPMVSAGPGESTAFMGNTTDMTEFMGALRFCEKCNESIPLSEIERGRAGEIDGKFYCSNCLEEMSNASEG